MHPLVILDLQDAEITDFNDLPMHAESIPGEVYIGIPPAAYTIQNTSGALIPGGTGTFDVHLDNTELVGTLQFTLVDIPESMTITNVTPVGRFDDGIVDGSSEEQEDGSYYFLGYDFISGIEAGSGPVLEFEVQFDDNLDNSSIIMSMASYATAALGSSSPLTTVFHGFGQFAGYFVALDEEVSIPGEFALHPNFPNPFNPTTSISFQVPARSRVSIKIYNLIGQEIRDLVEKDFEPGFHKIEWNGLDNMGRTAATGVYLIQMKSDHYVTAKKCLLLR